MTEFEIWKPCLEDLRYEVSTLGRVRSLGHASTGGRFIIGRVLKPYQMPSGYMQVSLGRNAKKYVHRLVCAAFYGEPVSGSEVSHLDGTRDNNEVRNLKWSTHSENEQTKSCTALTRGRSTSLRLVKSAGGLSQQCTRKLRRSFPCEAVVLR